MMQGCAARIMVVAAEFTESFLLYVEGVGWPPQLTWISHPLKAAHRARKHIQCVSAVRACPSGLPVRHTMKSFSLSSLLLHSSSLHPPFAFHILSISPHLTKEGIDSRACRQYNILLFLSVSSSVFSGKYICPSSHIINAGLYFFLTHSTPNVLKSNWQTNKLKDT